MLIVMNKSTHDDHISQLLQTKIEEYKISVTFLSGYNGIFIITNTNKNIYFTKSIFEKMVSSK